MNQKELSQVYYMRKELKIREKQLSDLMNSSLVGSPNMSGMPFSNTNEVHSKTEDFAEKKDNYIKAIEAYKQAIEIKVQAIDAWIMELDDVFLRQIIYYRCIDLMPWTKVAMMMGGGNTPDGCRMYFNRKIPKK